MEVDHKSMSLDDIIKKNKATGKPGIHSKSAPGGNKPKRFNKDRKVGGPRQGNG